MTGLSASVGKLPLDGLRVLDFTHAAAGPYATMFLGDMGAEVLKVERPGRGDGSRYMGEPLAGPTRSDYFMSLNRNKKSVLIDLQTDRGTELARRLAEKCDVVIQNFRPGVMERLGLSFEDLRTGRNELIYCSISAFGHEGEWRDHPANDVIMQALSGLMGMTGERGGGPVRIGAPISDYAAGLFALIGILTALNVRSRYPEGQHVRASMIDCSLALMCNYIPAVVDLGKRIPRLGRGHAQLVPYQGFVCADGEYLIVGAFTNAFWRSLATAVGHEEWLTDDRFVSNEARLQHRDELVPQLEAIFLTKPRADWMAILEEADVPNSPVLEINEALQTPPVRESGIVKELDLDGRQLHAIGLPVGVADWPAAPFNPPPPMGEHTAAVLQGLVGVTDDEFETLLAEGAVGVNERT